MLANYDISLPKNKDNSIILECIIDNYDEITKSLEKPTDLVFTTIIDSVAKDLADRLDKVKVIFANNNSFLILMDTYSKENLKDIQYLISKINSIVTLSFYRIFMSFILEYQDKVSSMDEELSDQDIEIIENRISALWSVLNSNPVFTTSVCEVSMKDEGYVLELHQKATELSAYTRYYKHFIGGDANPENYGAEILENGIEIPQRELNGSLTLFDNDLECWVTQILPKLYTEEENYEV